MPPQARTDPEAETAIQNLISMGYAEADVRAAMLAAFNNADRAFEYLNDGIPSSVQNGGMAAPPAGAGMGAPGAGAPGMIPMQPIGGGGADKFASIRALPYFKEMKQQIRENPSAIRAVLERVQRENPDLLDLINNNLDEFTALLNEDDSAAPAGGMPGVGMPGAGMPGPGQGISREQLAIMIQQLAAMPEADRNSALQSIGLTPEQYNQLLVQLSLGALGAGGAPGAGGAGAGGAGMGVTVQLTPEENAAVDRLIEIFQLPREVVIQAYLACDKNEEYAASYLSEHGADF